MYKILFTRNYKKSEEQFIKKNPSLKETIKKTLLLLSENPYYNSLKSHKVLSKRHGPTISSWVTGDIRILWMFDSKIQLQILAIDLGKHSGAQKIYK